MQLLVDNKSTISLSKNPVFHGRSKHIETKFHFLRDEVSKWRLELIHCSTKEKIVDIFTKALRKNIFVMLRESLDVKSLENLV